MMGEREREAYLHSLHMADNPRWMGALKVNTNLLSTTAGSWGEMILATLCVDMDVQNLRAPFFRCVTKWSGCVNYRRYKEIIFSNFFVLVFFS